MFNRFFKLIKQLRLSWVRSKDNLADPEKEESSVSDKEELPKLKRLEQAVSYNKINVPVFAPQGFPSSCGLESITLDSNRFAKEIGRIQGELGLSVDGFCGPQTIDEIAKRDREEKGERSILIGPQAYPINSDVITYQDDSNWGGLASRRRNQLIKQIVLHYDVSFNAVNTREILERRGLSYNFLIDGDDNATIYQTHNPTTHVCFHAGPVNNYSLGICINNPADPKYQDQDAQRRGRKREVREDIIHGNDVKLLSFFEEQLNKTSLLVDLLGDAFKIPKDFPYDEDGNIIKKVIDFENFSGIMGHYHISDSKIDPAPLNWKDLDLTK